MYMYIYIYIRRRAFRVYRVYGFGFRVYTIAL